MQNDYGMRVIERGRASLARLGSEIDEADPGGLVLPRSRVLCAGLAELAVSVLSALGPDGAEEGVSDLAASLSLLTKIDDEVIDGLGFHGGAESPRAIVRKKTEEFLDATWRSIETGEPHNSEPRCLLASHVGRRMRRLSRNESSHAALLALVRDGWQTQVDAVVALTGDPLETDAGEVARVTRRISGDWLALVAACGTLPAGDCLSDAEVEAIRDAGAFIQRADALADLEKDQREGLSSTWAACAIARTTQASSLAGMYRAAAGLELEQQATPSALEVWSIRHRLARFSELASAFEWIRTMLLSRYRAHALCIPAGHRPCLDESRTTGGVACGAR